METTNFTALCERAGRWWTIRVPQIEGMTAQVRSLDQAEIVARQLISRALAIPAEAIRVDVLPDAPAPVAHALQVRHAARQAAEAATRATRDALDALADEGIAFRDAATMLGLSPAEIGQYGPAVPGDAPARPTVTASPLQPTGPLSDWLGLSGWLSATASPRVLTVVSDEEIIKRIDAYCDIQPRERARAEELGPLVLFVPVGPGFPYYARPRAGDRGPVTAADVQAVRDRQRELKLPESFEWIEHSAPEMAAAAAGAGLRVHRHPMLVLETLAPSPPLPPSTSVRIMDPDDPDLLQAWAVPGVAFAHPGSEIGRAGVAERGRLAADHDPASIEVIRERLRAGRSVLATASGPNGPLASGSYQHAAGVAEITGIGVLPASRRRGLGAAVTHALAAHAAARDTPTIFLSAADSDAARLYTRLGFREIGTAMIAEPPDA